MKYSVNNPYGKVAMKNYVSRCHEFQLSPFPRRVERSIWKIQADFPFKFTSSLYDRVPGSFRGRYLSLRALSGWRTGRETAKTVRPLVVCEK